MNLIEKAKELAHEAHDSVLQKRKYNNVPYWEHTDSVAELVEATLRAANNGQLTDADAEVVAAAHLHDIFEDVTPKNNFYSPEFINKEFGRRVYVLVKELTDVYTKEQYPTYNRAQRKKMERDRVQNISPESKTIKLADLIMNAQDILTQDTDFAKVFLKEKFQVLPALVGGNSTLLARASQLTLNGFAQLKMEVPTVVAN